MEINLATQQKFIISRYTQNTIHIHVSGYTKIMFYNILYL